MSRLHDLLALIIRVFGYGSPKDFDVFSADQLLRNNGTTNVRRFERNEEFSTDCAPLRHEELKVTLKCMGTTYCCRDHTTMANISAGSCSWTKYVDWKCLHI